MKTILIALVSALSLSTYASTWDGDPALIYNSWCEQGNVIQTNADGAPAIKQNCAVTQQVCELDQKTSGKRVIYTASCVDEYKSGRE